jgi:hypothetical protein
MESIIESDDPRFYIAPSTIPDGGLGVFAAENLKTNTRCGYYMGRVFHKYPRQNRRNFQYILKVERRPPWMEKEYWKTEGPPIYIDGTNVLSRVNDPRGTKLKANTEMNTVGAFVLCANVKAGEELLVSYGDSYW